MRTNSALSTSTLKPNAVTILRARKISEPPIST